MQRLALLRDPPAAWSAGQGLVRAEVNRRVAREGARRHADANAGSGQGHGAASVAVEAQEARPYLGPCLAQQNLCLLSFDTKPLVHGGCHAQPACA